ncbi:hypothetical protein DFH09DRAFT_1366437, partial [Mycena vulgaris]
MPRAIPKMLAGFIMSCKILLTTDRSIDSKLWASLHHVLVDHKGKSSPNFSREFDDFNSCSALASVLRRDQAPLLVGRVVEPGPYSRRFSAGIQPWSPTLPMHSVPTRSLAPTARNHHHLRAETPRPPSFNKAGSMTQVFCTVP